MNQIFQNNIIKRESELKDKFEYMKNIIIQIYKENQKNNEIINKLKQEIMKKDNENNNLKDTLNKLKISYNDVVKKSGSSETILNGKVDKDKIKIKDIINKNQNK